MSAPGEPPASGGPLRRSLRLYEQVVQQLVTWADASGLGPVDELPVEPHDQRVTAVVTPSGGWLDLT